jgi:hypothetical protein
VTRDQTPLRRLTEQELKATAFSFLLDCIQRDPSGPRAQFLSPPLPDGSSLELRLSSTDTDTALVRGADIPLLLWLVNRALRIRQPDISWPDLAEFLGSKDDPNNRIELIESASRIGVGSVCFTHGRRMFMFIFVRQFEIYKASFRNPELDLVLDLSFLNFVRAAGWEEPIQSAAPSRKFISGS